MRVEKYLCKYSRKLSRTLENVFFSLSFTQKGNNFHLFVNRTRHFVKICARRKCICFRKKLCDYKCTNLSFCDTVNCFIDILIFFQNLKPLDDFAETEFRTFKLKLRRIFSKFRYFGKAVFLFHPIKLM